MKKVGILYISTGNYTVFWKEFFESAERFLLSGGDYEKNYFIFTDAGSIEYEENIRVHKVYQEPLSWPYITLDRFSIFQKARPTLDEMDYIYFFNGNMLLVDMVDEEIIPKDNRPLVLVKHPGFFNKARKEFTYEENSNSAAFVPFDQGIFYFMGGLNGGTTAAYLEMVETLEKRVELDKKSGIIAVWHDESHLNRYAIDHENKIKILDPIYGYPEGWNLPFHPKIIIRDKNNYGGHDFLRNKNNYLKRFRKFLGW